MYPAKHFQITSGDDQHNNKNRQQLAELIIENPLATLLIKGQDSFDHVSYIPVHFDSAKYYLLGHVSNQHPLATQLKLNQTADVNLLFHGEHGYISPNYVTGELSKEQGVPTWNYCNVNVCGTAKVILDEKEKYQHMQQTTDYFEQGQQSPWQLDSLSDKLLKQMFSAITMFTINIDDIGGRFKLSQNKSMPVRQQIAKQLQLQGKDKLAKQMVAE
jgi:transcriptional regulator